MTQAQNVKGQYLADFKAHAGNGAASGPAWLRAIREAAIGRFGELGFPTTRQEDWRFTSVQAIAEAPFAVRPGTTPSDVPPGTVSQWALTASGDPRLVFIDGVYAEQLSSAHGLPPGVRLESLARAVERDPALVEPHLARYARFQDHAFAALNSAFLRDGALVYVPATVELSRPVELLYLSTAAPERVVSHPRTLIVMDRLARASVVETYATVSGQGTHWTNAVTELILGDGARLDLYRVQRESREAYHVATTQSFQGRDSVLAVHPIALGSALARHDLNAVLGGSGALCTLNGLYLAGGRQHVDHHTVIDHAQPHCESHEYFNGVLTDRAHGVFNGRIIVRPGAQRTDSKQTNNNLLLSEQARADSQPQLEIYADDVKCTHGATLGPLDRQAMFYLRSRGLGEEEARGMLTYGFGAEILDRMELATVRTALDRLVRAWLGAGPGQVRAA